MLIKYISVFIKSSGIIAGPLS